ncbi:hypothetical protein KJ762_11535 [bacterium]|nr:hypothetical protein [bacterium]MBU1065748.1 hypothetical protein [bacterium]MBU1635122.1 hypothetical protein [bacterium]MBU1875088.1 hypothetical protein [bacterium]
MKNSTELYQQICEYLGCDLNSEPCKQIQDHLAECPNCEVYVDKVKQTVNLYKTIDNCDDIPEDVCTKLFISLNIDDVSKSDKESAK